LLAGWVLRKAAFGAAIRSVAVLPLRSLDNKAEGDLFSDGLTDDLVLHLSAIPNLRVISSTSSFALRGTTKTLREVGALLDVESVVEGSIRMDGGRIQAMVRLVRAANDTVVWSGAFDREQRDVAGLQKELASRIVVALRPRLRNVTMSGPAMDPEAQQLFLRGMAANRKYTVPDLTQSVRYFEQAAEKDPGSPRPWWALGLSYMRLRHLRQMTLGEARERAQAAARRALEIDARCAEAHTVMGWVYWRDVKAADAEFRQAIALNPNSAEALDFYGIFLERHNRKAEALDTLLRAQRLDPLSSDIALHLYFAYLAHGRYDDAMALVLRERIHSLGPYDHRIGHVLLAKGDCAGAVEAIRRAKLPEPNVQLAVALVCSGNRDEARKQLVGLEQAAAAGKASPVYVARVYVALGEMSAALDWLERVGQSDPWPHNLGVDNAEVWKPLRSEARFQALRKRIGADE
jgi:TolB-like protein/Flp pilus assembly protein TadD